MTRNEPWHQGDPGSGRGLYIQDNGEELRVMLLCHECGDLLGDYPSGIDLDEIVGDAFSDHQHDRDEVQR